MIISEEFIYNFKKCSNISKMILQIDLNLTCIWKSIACYTIYPLYKEEKQKKLYINYASKKLNKDVIFKPNETVVNKFSVWKVCSVVI